MAEKLFTVRFTAAELSELSDMLANGVCEYERPENAVAASGYHKLSEARVRAYRKQKREDEASP